MTTTEQPAAGWWLASDGNWYPPELAAQPDPDAPKNRKRWPWVVGGIVGVFLALVVLGAIVGPPPEDTGQPVASTSSAPVQTTAVPTTAVPTTTIDPVDQVVAQINAAGLPIVNPRDNTSKDCGGDMPCSRWVTADNITIVEWNTPEDAAKWTDGPLRSFLATPTITVHTSDRAVDLATFAGALGIDYESVTTTAAPAQPAAASVVYDNCDEAKAAGAVPIQRGQPGYSAKLDRDGDGTACDK